MMNCIAQSLSIKSFFNIFSDEVFEPQKYGNSKILFFNSIINHPKFEKIIN